MSGHVPPHRWADAWAGRVGAAERAEMDRHADGCRACARARARVKGASDSFSAIRAQGSPELAWDAVRARVHWSVSTERRARDARRGRRGATTGARAAVGAWGAGAAGRRWLPRLAIGGLACGAAAIALLTGPIDLRGGGGAAAGAGEGAVAAGGVGGERGAPGAPGARPAEAARPLIALVTRATGDVMIDGLRSADPFARALGPGARIATGAGRVDVQFGDASAFALGPGSRLELRALDADAVELVIDGTVDLEVSPRAPHQRLVVLAGSRRIEVRGTRFRVRHDTVVTEVATSRGLVAVHDAAGGPTLEVPAARGVVLPASGAVAAGSDARAAAPAQVRALTAEQLGALAEAAPLWLPAWDPATLLASSAPLEIAAATVAGGRREVRLDGVEIGAAPVRVRVLPGRHTIEAADGAGRFRRVGWVDVAAPVAGAPRARFAIPAEPAPTPDVSARRRQLKSGIDRAKLGQCMRRIAKQGLTGTYVQIEIAVDAAGAVNFLNIVDTDLGSTTASCVRDVLADVRFGAGAPATWRERIDL